MSSRVEQVEWRVETDQTEDDFGASEQDAREWMAYCKTKPDWMPAVLLSRTVVIETTEWTKAMTP